ncbi:MAG TPA: LysR family transcriptional regulator [Oxalobacteraceae bacterium]|jgi:DNA-binding transcriptional LysR family regulator|nr:LysR family transcriptional regulator [Oxalobacteraceae bacterium]HCN88831.1 LysR family transcriptional regulator [Oxalobacteraceae bacterium]
MRLSLRQLQIFLAVCDLGSTTAAANAIALSQSAVSAGLNELEGLLDIQLFDRVGKRLIINDNGRLLLPQARQILDTAATIEQQFEKPDASTAIGLNIGTSTTIGIYLLPKILASFSPQRALATPRILIANTAEVASAVASFAVDIGLIEGPCHEPDLHVERWITDELIVVCAPSHPLAAGKPHRKVPLKALRETGWLLREAGSGTREAVEHALVPHLHYLHSAAEFSNSEAIKHAAAVGLGVACLPRLVVADLLNGGQLVELNTALPVLRRHFYLVHRKHKILSARLSGFMQFCRDWKIERGVMAPV